MHKQTTVDTDVGNFRHLRVRRIEIGHARWDGMINNVNAQEMGKDGG